MRPNDHIGTPNENRCCDRCHAYKPRYELAPTTCQLWIAESQVSLFMGLACFACRTTLTQIAGVGAIKRVNGTHLKPQISKETQLGHRSTSARSGGQGVPGREGGRIILVTMPKPGRLWSGRGTHQGVRSRNQSRPTTNPVRTARTSRKRARASSGAAHSGSKIAGQGTDSEEQGQLLR